MTAFLSSLKADLLDRRLLPILALVGVALAAALAYAILGGGGGSASSPSPVATSAPPVSSGASGIPVSQAPASANQAVAETTSGSAQQRGGSSRNPFTPLPGTSSASSSSAASAGTAAGSSKASGAGSASKSGSSSPSSAEKSPATTPKPSAPAKTKTVYHVAVLFGVAPTGTPPQGAPLTPYVNLSRQAPLPSSKQPLIVFRGVTAGAKSATFTLVGEAILRGPARCLPSPSQCQAIELKVGQSEELEYLPPSGAPVTYQLQLVSITSTKATAAQARKAFRGESKAGRELLRRIGLTALPGLRYSQLKGVLVSAAHPRLGARAHTALERSHS
jgi:hypothetical protein